MSQTTPTPAQGLALYERMLLIRRNPVAILNTLLTRQSGPALLLLAATLVFAFAVVTRRPGMAGLIDTYFLPALLAMLLAEIGDERLKASAETLGSVDGVVIGVGSALPVVSSVNVCGPSISVPGVKPVAGKVATLPVTCTSLPIWMYEGSVVDAV